MGGENRRVSAQSAAHAQGLTDNLVKQGFEVESRGFDQWVLRKRRRRGDHVVTIVIQDPLARPDHTRLPPPPPRPPGASPWGPPAG